MSLPKPFLEEIRARVPLSDIISKRIKLTRAGKEYKGCCPFHNEKTPSFTVNNQKGFYHCFGCGAHGDVIGFLINHDNLSFMQAVEQLAGIAGMQVPKPSPEAQKQFAKQMSMYDLMDIVAKFYEEELHNPKNKKILQYLLDRGLSLSTIQSFRIGLSPQDDRDGKLRQGLKKSGYNIEDIVDSGVFRKSTKVKGDVYPFFRGRIMFPVQDFQGRVVAFGGRAIPESHGGPPNKSSAKYINSSESSIFHKGRMLYGLSRARKAIGDGEPVIVVEGYMDVIALAQAGFKAAVAPLGTALTEAQIEALWKVMPDENKVPILCFDGDNAGQRAAGRSLERILPILKPDHTARFAFLPPEHDPDSLIKDEGVAAMQKVLDQAIGAFDMMWKEESKDRHFNTPEAKAGFRNALKTRARTILNQAVQEFFIYEINQAINKQFFSTGESQGNFKKQWQPSNNWKKKPINGLHTPYRPPRARVEPIKTSKLLHEKILIATMINYPELFDEFGEELGMIKVPHPDYDQVRQDLLELLSKNHNHLENSEIALDDQGVKQHLREMGHDKILDAIFDKSLYLHAGFAKPNQPLEDVRQGWMDTYKRGIAQSRWKKA